MGKQVLTLIADEDAQAIAQAAYSAVLVDYAAQPLRHVWAWDEARAAVMRAYPVDAFCVAREKPIHRAIRDQACNAANACVWGA